MVVGNKEPEVSAKPYKIQIGDKILVRRKDIMYNEQPLIFYHTEIKKKSKVTGEFESYRKELYFRSGTDLKDRTTIKIKNMYEEPKKNKNDKYHPIWGLFILDYEIIDENYFEELQEYNSLLNSNKDIENNYYDSMITF